MAISRDSIIARGRSIHKTPVQGGSVFAGTPTAASLTTALAGTNNDLKYTAKDISANGNSVRVRYVVAGVSTSLSVSVSGLDITVNVATDGSSAATSTAAQVKAAVEASQPAANLVTVANAPGNDGTGVVTALGFTSLAGGVPYVLGSPSSRIAGHPVTNRGYSTG